MDASSQDIAKMVKEIVTTHLQTNTVAPAELPKLIRDVAAALREVQGVAAAPDTSATRTATAPKAPAVPISKSVTPDAIICLEDGKPFKMLKRYLRAQYNMTPEQYKSKWGLPTDYPMVAPNYSAEKSAYAKHVGLGTYARSAA